MTAVWRDATVDVDKEDRSLLQPMRNASRQSPNVDLESRGLFDYRRPFDPSPPPSPLAGPNP